jgi:hypothetical protein
MLSAGSTDPDSLVTFEDHTAVLSKREPVSDGIDIRISARRGGTSVPKALFPLLCIFKIFCSRILVPLCEGTPDSEALTDVAFRWSSSNPNISSYVLVLVWLL